MKKIVTISLFVLTLLLLVGCEEEEPYWCGCPKCIEQDLECSEYCAYETNGKCSCEGCVPDEVLEDVNKYVVERIDSMDGEKVSKHVKYPQLQNIENKTLEANVNRLIQESFKPYTSEIVMMAEGFVPEGSQEKDDMFSNKVFRYDVDFDSYLLDGKYLSLVINHRLRTGEIVQGQNGTLTDGIRSNDWVETYMIDVQDPYRNEVLKLNEICSSIPEKDIVDEINRQAQQRNIEIFLGTGLKKLAVNQSFYIDKNSQKLVIYFEPGSITKFGMGSITFEMPYTYNASTKLYEK